MKPRIIITSILMLFMSSSISWGQEPININDLYEITQLSTSEHTINGNVEKNTFYDNPFLCPYDGCGFVTGTDLEIRTTDNKLLQKLIIQCEEKNCSITGTIFPHGKYVGPTKVIEMTSYSVGIEPNSQYVQDFLYNNLNGVPVFYEGSLNWGDNYYEISGELNKYPYSNLSFLVNNLTEDKKLELLEFHNNCSKGRITGSYFLGSSDGIGVDGIMVNEFKCLD